MWGRLGWFSGLVCASGVAGAIAWGTYMQSNSFYYEAYAPGVTDQQNFAQLASHSRWYAVFLAHYPVDFLCLIISTLMLLRRLSNHASHSYFNSQDRDMDDKVDVCDCIGEYALEKLHRVIDAVVVVCSVVGMLAMDVAAAYIVQEAGLYDQAAAACDAQGKSTDKSTALITDASVRNTTARTAASVQAVLEAVVLVIMSTAYMVFMPVCVATFGRAERRLIGHLSEIEHKADNVPVFLPAEFSRGQGSSSGGRKVQMRCDKALELMRMTLAVATAQRRRFVAACGVVLITFILRASFDLLKAYDSFNTSENPDCDICDPCQPDAFLIRIWLSYTPEFQAIVVNLSSSLPLVVSLWLMMTKEERAQLLSTQSRTNPDELERRSAEVRQLMAIDLL